MDLYDELGKIVDVFEAESLDYAICGGIAVAFHGYPRFTRDIDLMARQVDIDRVMSLLDTIGFSEQSGRIPFELHDLYRTSKSEETDILRADVIAISSALQEVWDDRNVFDWDGRRLRVVSAEGFAKLTQLAGWDQDLLDCKDLWTMDGTNLRRAREPDMSCAAIDRRLRDMGQLYKLGMSIMRA